ncbi:hypothetical protein ACW9HE_13015 [Nocardia gipuzkoensis]|uniref:hypothetical protein n=1 Tax=Nocardia abscessus TaxID=120957 RepID=UPI002457BD79|nr:hypothetical protein [Nocardia abscessus]
MDDHIDRNPSGIGESDAFDVEPEVVSAASEMRGHPLGESVAVPGGIGFRYQFRCRILTIVFRGVPPCPADIFFVEFEMDGREVDPLAQEVPQLHPELRGLLRVVVNQARECADQLRFAFDQTPVSTSGNDTRAVTSFGYTALVLISVIF